MSPSSRCWRAVFGFSLTLVWVTSALAEESLTPQAAQPSAQGAKPIVLHVKGQLNVHVLPRFIEGESFVGTAQVSAGPVSAQNMSGFGSGWSGNAQLFWQPPDPVDTPIRNWPHLTFYVDIAVAGTYALAIRHTRAPDYGDVRVFVRSLPVVDLSGYAASVEPARVEAGQVKLKAGKNQVVLTVFRRPTSSQASFVGLDALELTRLP